MIKTKSSRKNKISQLFAMRTAIAKSRYKNPVGFFRGAQAINLSAHSFPGQDSGLLFRPTHRNPPNGHGQNGHGPIVRLSDGRAENTSIKEFQWRTPRRVLQTRS